MHSDKVEVLQVFAFLWIVHRIEGRNELDRFYRILGKKLKLRQDGSEVGKLFPARNNLLLFVVYQVLKQCSQLILDHLLILLLKGRHCLFAAVLFLIFVLLDDRFLKLTLTAPVWLLFG